MATQREDIRIVYMTYPALYSLIMLNYWLKKSSSRNIVGILLSDFDFKKNGKELPFWQAVTRVIKQSGLQYAIYELFITHLVPLILNLWNISRKIAGKKKKIFTFQELSQKYAIPLYKSKDFNDKKTMSFLKNVNATLIISGFNNQIINRSLLKFPFYGCINIHPSYLPDFRGADAAFAALYHGVKETGFTIHYMERKIDTGPIIAQEKLRIRAGDSLFSLNVRLWMHGAKLLTKSLKQLTERNITPKKQDNRLCKYGYESFPTKQKIGSLRKRGILLFTIRDIKHIFKE